MSVTPVKPLKAFEPQQSLWDSVRTFYIGMKFFGYAYYSIDGKIEDGKVKSTFLDTIIAIFVTTTLLCLIYLNYAYNLSLIATKSRIIDMGSRGVLLFEITNVLITQISMYIRRNDIWGIFKRLYKLDNELHSIGMRLNHKFHLRNFIFLALTSIATYGVMSILTCYFLYVIVQPENAEYLILSYLVINASMTMSLLAIAFLLFGIYLRFDLINKAICKYFVTEEDETISEQKSSPYLCKIIGRLGDYHDTLVDIIVAFNSCFSFQLMIVIAGMFMTNIFSIFAIYRVFVRYDYSQYERSIIQFTWNVYFLLYGLAIISLASLVTRIGKYTAVLVHKAVNFISDDDDPVIDYVRNYLVN
jgi:hypothetical protein